MCIGSARFGIEPHEAPVEDFPRQPSQKDGLGRMCRTDWNQYTAGLARDAKARKAAAAAEVTVEPEGPAPEPTARDAAMPPEADSQTDASSATEEQPAPKRKRPRTAVVPAAGSQGDAG